MKRLAQQLYRSLLSYESRLWLYRLRHAESFKRKRSVVYDSDKGAFSLKPFDEHHCLFVHITKTAGTAVAKSLFGYLPYHYTAIDYRVIYGRRDFNAYYKFAFVRNPWDRVYSAYRYLKAGGWNDDDKQWYQSNLAQYQDFKEFIENWLTQPNIEKHRHFWPQHRFICDARGNIIIDQLAYFETLDDDFDAICKRLSIDTHLKPHNTNPGSSYRDVYDDAMRAIVAKVYAKDIALFGYDFNGIAKRVQLSH